MFFAPYFESYQIHNYRVSINGQVHLWGTDDIKYQDGRIRLGSYDVGSGLYDLVIDIDYFYKSQIFPPWESYLKREKIWFHDDETQQKRFDIIAQHYTDGQFALDNGLYKEAVWNFAVVLETLVKKDLDQWKKRERLSLCDSINASSVTQEMKDDMHFIRTIRNNIHPKKLIENSVCTQQEAIKCRQKLEKILHYFCS